MRTTIITALVAGVVTLAGCGGGSTRPNTPTNPPPVGMPQPPPPVSSVPIPRPERATQAPMLLDALIGLPYLNPPDSVLTTVARHTTPASHTGWSPVDTGVAADGTLRADLIRYLSADIAASGGTLNRFASPPVIHFAAGATDQDINATIQALQVINAALPDAWQLTISATAKAAGTRQAAAGEILMVFADDSEWPVGCDHGLACTDARINAQGDIASASIFADPSQQTDPMYAVWIAHELLHALGREHADPQQFPQSLMVPQENLSRAADILDILDRDALLAVYGMLAAGDTSADLYQKLGAWEHESFHVMGGLPFGEDSSLWFGVADRNAEQSAWVIGTISPTALADNPQLSGSARWEGRVLGMTPTARIVAGAAELGINLSTLSGELAFTGLEQWASRANPGDIGTGTPWGDGDLRYGVQVRGSTFVKTGGDAGIVTGKFIGPAHDAMGGILDRDDLDAAFGGTR